MDFNTSKPVRIVPYDPNWILEFQKEGTRLRKIVKDTVVRIDHIGSTSVPQLAAKNIIDIQLSIRDLEQSEQFVARMLDAGYRKRGDIRYDELVGADPLQKNQLKKLYFREAEGNRRVHIHVRQMGNINQRYALLFRDYLKANEQVRGRYQLLKYRLAELFPNQIDGYLYIKDPLMDIIYSGASDWAHLNHWEMDNHFL